MYLLKILLYNISAVRTDWIKFLDVCPIPGENLHNKLKCLSISKKIIIIGFFSYGAGTCNLCVWLVNKGGG